MSQVPRLLISDVDGTLVRHDKMLADATVTAIARLGAAGVPTLLISARPPSGLRAIAETLALDGPLGAFNGGTLVDARSGRVLKAERLAPDAAARVVDRLTGVAGVEIWVFAQGRWYARDPLHPRVPREKLSAGLDPVIVPDFSDLLADVDKIVGVSEDHAMLAAIEADLQGTLGDQASVLRSQPYFLDITAPGANKGDGIAAMAEAAGVALSDVAVIGDMPNDLPMFARAGLAIAMGQAPDPVRAAARHVTASNEEDGVARAIEQWLLPAAVCPTRTDSAS